LVQIFDIILYTPLFNLLVFLYNTIAFHDFGVAIFFLTFIIRFFLSPLSFKSLKSQKELAYLQPKIKEIQEKFKNDRSRQALEMMKIYEEHKINPFSGCFLLLIQLPILIALYRVSIIGFSESSLVKVYSFISRPSFLNPISFGFIDLTKRSVLLSLVAGVLQFFQMKQSFSKGSRYQDSSRFDQVAAFIFFR